MADGSRTRNITEQSLGTVTGVGGVNLGPRTGAQSGDGGNGQQSSQGDHAGNADQTTTTDPGAQANGNQGGNAHQPGAQDGASTGAQGGDQSQGGGAQDGQQTTTHQTNSSGYTPEEQAEWDRLTKKTEHGDRKITELAQANSSLEQENGQLKQQLAQQGQDIGQLKSMISQMLSGNANGNQQGNATASYGGAPNYDEGSEFNQSQFGGDGNGNQNGQQNNGQQITNDELQELVGRTFNFAKQYGDRFDAFEANLQKDKDLAYIQTELGCTREAAEAMVEKHSAGDIVGLAKVFELSTLPAQARQIARENREAQRQSTYHPATGGAAPFAPALGDETQLRAEAEKIMGMQDGQPKARALDRFMADNPLAMKVVAELSGFRI